MEGPPETPYENGVFDLFCQFGPDYPVKPPSVRFVSRVSCQINGSSSSHTKAQIFLMFSGKYQMNS